MYEIENWLRIEKHGEFVFVLTCKLTSWPEGAVDVTYDHEGMWVKFEA